MVWDNSVQLRKETDMATVLPPKINAHFLL